MAKNKSAFFTTTLGEFVEAVYDAAFEEYMDEVMAKRITMQMLLRKLRAEDALARKLNKQGSAKAKKEKNYIAKKS